MYIIPVDRVCISSQLYLLNGKQALTHTLIFDGYFLPFFVSVVRECIVVHTVSTEPSIKSHKL